MNRRASRLSFKPQHVSVFAFLVTGLVLLTLLFPIQALLNRTTVLRIASVATYGGTSTETGTSLAVDASGNQYILGTFQGTASFGNTEFVSNGNIDGVVFKRTPAGEIEWAIQAGGAGLDGVLNIDTDAAGDVYVGMWVNGDFSIGETDFVGFGSNDALLFKLDSSGVLQWTKYVGATGGDLTEWTGVGPDNYIYWTGTFINSADFDGTVLTGTGGGIGNAFIAKYNTTGTLQWVVQGESTGNSRADGTVFLGDGSLAVAGQYNGTLTYGTEEITSGGGTDGYILMLGTDGGETTLYSYGGTGTQTMGELVVDNQGALYARASYTAPDSLVLGDFTLTATEGTEAALFRVNPDTGAVIWAKSLKGTSTNLLYFSNNTNTSTYGLVFAGLHVGGEYDGTTLTTNGGSDFTTMAVDPATGELLWFQNYGTASNDNLRDLNWDGQKYIGVGTIFADANLDGITATSAGGSDIMILTLEHPNYNQVKPVSASKPGVVSVQSHAQEIAPWGTLFRTRVINEGQSPLYSPKVKDRVCATKYWTIVHGDDNENQTLDIGETWDLFCLKSSPPVFDRTVTVEMGWASTVMTAYTNVASGEQPYLESLARKKSDLIELGIYREQDEVLQIPGTWTYVLRSTGLSRKNIDVQDDACENLWPIWPDKDGRLGMAETWVYLCTPKKDTTPQPSVKIEGKEQEWQ